MGTRSLTFVYDEYENSKIVNMYRQFDGYPSGHGAELATFLRGSVFVNGYAGKDAPQFNGMSCMAAQMVAHFKDGVGGFYLYPTKQTDLGQDYEYHVYKDKVVVKQCYGKKKQIFSGSYEDFERFCAMAND